MEKAVSKYIRAKAIFHHVQRGVQVLHKKIPRSTSYGLNVLKLNMIDDIPFWAVIQLFLLNPPLHLSDFAARDIFGSNAEVLIM